MRIWLNIKGDATLLAEAERIAKEVNLLDTQRFRVAGGRLFIVGTGTKDAARHLTEMVKAALPAAEVTVEYPDETGKPLTAMEQAPAEKNPDDSGDDFLRKLREKCAICGKHPRRRPRPGGYGDYVMLVTDPVHGDRVHQTCMDKRKASELPSEQKASITPRGTCQACFRKQKTSDGKMVLHGYQRPGYGYIVGECWGVKYAPFELSCERTKDFITNALKPALRRFQAEEKALLARPETVRYPARVWVGYEQTSRAERGYKDFEVTVKRDAPAGYVETTWISKEPRNWGPEQGGRRAAGAPELAHHPPYDVCLASEVKRVRGMIEQVTTDLRFFEGKVAEWKPVPWPTDADRNPRGGNYREDVEDWDDDEPCVQCGGTDYDENAGQCEECGLQACANCWVDGRCFVCFDPTAEDEDEENPATLPPLTVADVVAIHAGVQNAGGPHHDNGVRDEALLVSLVDWHYPSLMSTGDPDPFFVAASLGHNVVDRHPFWDCNHRTGWTLIVRTLVGFGYSFDAIKRIPRTEVIEFIRGIDRDGKTVEDVAEWLRAHAKASSWARNAGSATISRNPSVQEKGRGSRFSERGTMRGASVRPAMGTATHGAHINLAEENPASMTYEQYAKMVRTKFPTISNEKIRGGWNLAVKQGKVVEKAPVAPPPAAAPPVPAPKVEEKPSTPPVPTPPAPPPPPKQESPPPPPPEPETRKPEPPKQVPPPVTAGLPIVAKQAEVEMAPLPPSPKGEERAPLQIFETGVTGDSAKALELVRSGKFDRREVMDMFRGLGASVGKIHSMGAQHLRRQVNKQQFLTPLRVTEAWAKICAIPQNATVLDPNCGAGRAFWGVPNQKLVHGIDVAVEALEIAKAVYPEGQFLLDDIMNQTFNSEFDYVFINPPFSLPWTDELNFYQNAVNGRRIQSDIAMVELAVRAVKPGGIFGMVLPVNTFTEKTGQIGRWVRKRATMLACLVLPKDVKEFYFAIHGTPIALFIFWKNPKRQLGRRPPKDAISDGKTGSYDWPLPDAKDMAEIGMGPPVDTGYDCGWFEICKTWEQFDKAVHHLINGRIANKSAPGEVVCKHNMFEEIIKPYAESRKSTTPVRMQARQRIEEVKSRKFGLGLKVESDDVVTLKPRTGWPERINTWQRESPELVPNSQLAAAYVQMMRAGYRTKKWNAVLRVHEDEFDVHANRLDRLYYGDVAFDEMVPVSFLRRFGVNVVRTQEFDDFFARKLAWAKVQAAPFEQMAKPNQKAPASDPGAWVEFNSDVGLRSQFKEVYDQTAARFDWLANQPQTAFLAKLYPHQKDDAIRLSMKSSSMYCAMMGLGKSMTGASTMFIRDAKRTCIVVPPKLLNNWRNEFQRMNMLSYMAVKEKQGKTAVEAQGEWRALITGSGIDPSEFPVYHFAKDIVVPLPIPVITHHLVDPRKREMKDLVKEIDRSIPVFGRGIALMATTRSALSKDMDEEIRKEYFEKHQKDLMAFFKKWLSRSSNPNAKVTRILVLAGQRKFYPDWTEKWKWSTFSGLVKTAVNKEFGYAPELKMKKLTDTDEAWVKEILEEEGLIEKGESPSDVRKALERGETEGAERNPLYDDEYDDDDEDEPDDRDVDYNTWENPGLFGYSIPVVENPARGAKKAVAQVEGTEEEEDEVSTTYFGHVVGDLFDYVVVDEAHIFSNAKSSMSRALMGLQPKAICLLSGTPMRNKVMGLFTQLDFGWKSGSAAFPYTQESFVRTFGRVMYYDQFSKIKFTAEEQAHSFLGKETVKQLKEDEKVKLKAIVLPEIESAGTLRLMLDSMMLRRRKDEPGVEEFVKIPEPTIETIELKADETHFAFYEEWAEVAAKILAEYLGIKREVVGFEDEEGEEEQEGDPDAVGVSAIVMALISKLMLISNAPQSPSVGEISQEALKDMYPEDYMEKRRRKMEKAMKGLDVALKQEGFQYPTYGGGLTTKQQWVLDFLKKSKKDKENTLVLMHNLDTLKIFSKALKDEGIDFIEIYGDVSFQQRYARLEEMKKTEGGAAILATIGTMDTGLNIPEARNVIIVDPDWNYANQEQAWSRVLRSKDSPGKRPAGGYRVMILCNVGFVDSYIWKLAQMKGDWTKDIIDREEALEKTQWSDLWDLLTTLTLAHYGKGLKIELKPQQKEPKDGRGMQTGEDGGDF